MNNEKGGQNVGNKLKKMPPPRNASRGKNEMIVERQSTETWSLRCCREPGPIYREPESLLSL